MRSASAWFSLVKVSSGCPGIAMSFAILSLVTDGEVRISDPDCVNISAPTFYEDLKSLLS